MNQEIKDRWVKALRSGKFKQGKDRLCGVTKDGKRQYCCLGVLSQLAVRSRVIGAPALTKIYDPNDEAVSEARYGNGEYYYLPYAVRDWAGLEEANPYAGDNKLSEWNDGDSARTGETFSARDFDGIADLIEEYL